MIKKLILSSLIGWSFQTQSEVSDKYVLEAGKPLVQQAEKSTANQLVLSVGVFDPLKETLDFSKSKIKRGESSKYSIVQFYEGKVDSLWLSKNGVEIVSYMPNNAFVVRLNELKKDLIAKSDKVRWIGNYLSNYKISPRLYGIKNKTKDKRNSSINLSVTVFKDYTKKHIPALIKKHLPFASFAIPYNPAYSSNLVLNISNDKINEALSLLASIDEVKWVNVFHFDTINNTEATSAVQANKASNGVSTDDFYVPGNTPIWDKGLTGAGQIVAVADSGLDSDEDWFVHYDNGQTVTHIVTESESTNILPQIGTIYPDRKVLGYFTMPLAVAYEHQIFEFHGTHVTGSVAGDRREAINNGPNGSFSSPDTSGYDNDDGMAPNAQLLFQDCGGSTEREDSDGNLFAPILCFSGPMFQQAFNAGARIHSNSYGGANIGYSSSDASADDMLRNNEDMLILFAAGNDGSDANTISSSSQGKNMLTVGALSHGNSSILARFSSRGPTDDNRIKPDITATGISIESARGNEQHSTSINTSPQRSTQSGTSMSTPITAGSAALMRQYYTDGFYPTGSANSADAHNPTGPLMKATLINGANTDVGHFNGDAGWGRVWLENSLPFTGSEQGLRAWEITNKDGLKTNEEMLFTIEAKDDQPIIATLTWYDVAGPLGSNKTLVNDLDLSIENNGTLYKGNNFSEGVSIEGGQSDTINSVEQVRISSHESGIFTIKVSAPSIPGDGNQNSNRQGFALVVSANFDNITSNPQPLTPVSNFTVSENTNFNNQLSWNDDTNADYFEIYRVEGSCSTADHRQFRYIGNSLQTEFIDSDNLGAFRYAYKVRPAQFKELGPLSSCIDIESTRLCNEPPEFNQSSIVVADSTGDVCHVELQWQAATSVCPDATGVRYNVYRSSDINFTPSNSTLIASTGIDANSFDDTFAPSGEPTFYIVTAEDNTTVGNGPNQGNESITTTAVVATTLATTTTVGTLVEDIDNTALMNLNFPWQITDRRASNSILSYHSGPDVGNYPENTCGRMVTRTLSIPSGSVDAAELVYQARYNIEQNWDGVVVEISTNDGATWSDLPPNGGYPSSFSQTSTPPINICQYPSTHGAFSGSTNGAFQTFSHDLSQFAGQSIKMRWSLSTDPSAEEEGFYIDNIEYRNIDVPNACTVNTAPPEPEKPQAGLYFDPTHNGHGFVLEPIANTDLYFTVFYTYQDDGTPEWYTSLATLENNTLSASLDRVTYDFTVDPVGANLPLIVDTSINRNITLDFNSSSTAAAACSDASVGLTSWQIGAQLGDWCIQHIDTAIGIAPASNDFGGTWWTGIDDDGWGLSMTFAGDLVLVTIYYFDADGNPRWVQGNQPGFQTGQEITIAMREVEGYSRDDSPPASFVLNDAGSLSLTINGNTGDNQGVIDLDITYQGAQGGSWIRSNVPLSLFTESH